MIPATQKKLQEARFFLGHLREQAQAVPARPEEFEFFLSAFLSASRSVTFALQVEAKEKYDVWFPGWLTDRSVEEQRLLKFMNTQRTAEVHQRGAEVSTALESIPVTEVRFTGQGHSAHYGFHWFGPPGIEVPRIGRSVYQWEIGGTAMEVVDACARYLALLDQLVREFIVEHS